MTPHRAPATPVQAAAAPASGAAGETSSHGHDHGHAHDHGHGHGRVDLDRVGAVASFVCAVHCAAIPVLLVLGGAGLVPMLDNRAVGWVEWGFVGVAAVIATTSAWRGYRAHRRLPVAFALAGSALALVTLMVVASLAGHDHAHEHDQSHVHEGAFRWLFPALGLAVAVSHLVNRRLLRTCCA